ncbi:transcriptional regulator [Ectopseudomonas mendocina]|nr:transcriptional regulator [Pseudomonas mendocina]TRO23738.1 transcriptional regulator [Pseudomonas mendocina]
MQPKSPNFTTNAPLLLTMKELETLLCRTRSGIDKLRARDTDFPRPLKDGVNRRSRIYFVREEVEQYICARLDQRQEVQA